MNVLVEVHNLTRNVFYKQEFLDMLLERSVIISR